MNDAEEPVINIRRKYLNNIIEKDNTKKYQFQGQPAILTRWFDLYTELLEANFCRPEPYLYEQLFIMNIEGREME